MLERRTEQRLVAQKVWQDNNESYEWYVDIYKKQF